MFRYPLTFSHALSRRDYLLGCLASVIYLSPLAIFIELNAANLPLILGGLLIAILLLGFCFLFSALTAQRFAHLNWRPSLAIWLTAGPLLLLTLGWLLVVFDQLMLATPVVFVGAAGASWTVPILFILCAILPGKPALKA